MFFGVNERDVSLNEGNGMSSTHHGILLHVVFSTKHRHPHLADSWRDELFAVIGGIAKEQQALLLAAGGVEDHIHLLLKMHPKFAISDTLRTIKANSSGWINKENKIGCRHEWQRGYGAFSVSQSMVETVRSYLARQREHHQRQTFQDEYLEMLRRHQIEFNPQYVFDEEIVS
ncbi:REP element-mobilizing transposase RayT [Neorhodopirellula lusitana]|uniref:REP element-mobilizing transposase RayT n=2 Tax=Neorhodopirellula lusitana TaxID=445327 RepID=A0ABY1PQZ8_9BACT|nr:REP element-mobilizing transposase RayT [Neorhodopirellula lusitana]